jgi:hypothetical protein
MTWAKNRLVEWRKTELRVALEGDDEGLSAETLAEMQRRTLNGRQSPPER